MAAMVDAVKCVQSTELSTEASYSLFSNHIMKTSLNNTYHKMTAPPTNATIITQKIIIHNNLRMFAVLRCFVSVLLRFLFSLSSDKLSLMQY